MADCISSILYVVKSQLRSHWALLGFPVFGRRSITVHKDGQVSSVVKVCFGTDFERATYSADLVGRAAQANKQLRPGTTGPRYYAGGAR